MNAPHRYAIRTLPVLFCLQRNSGDTNKLRNKRAEKNGNWLQTKRRKGSQNNSKVKQEANINKQSKAEWNFD